MDNTYPYQAPSEQQRPPAYSGGYVETPYAANRPPTGSGAPDPMQLSPSLGPRHSEQVGPGWTPTPTYYGNQGYGYNVAPPPFGGPHFAPPYGFDPSVPPPPFGCPPPGHMVPPAPANTYGNAGTYPPQFRPGPQPFQHDFHSFSGSGQTGHQDYEGYCERGGPLLPSPGCRDQGQFQGRTTQPENEETVQRRQDNEWLRLFLQRRDKKSKSPPSQQRPPDHSCVPALKDALYGAVRLVSALEESCETLKQNVENDCVWTDSYAAALNMKSELQHKLKLLSDENSLKQIKARVSRLSKRKARRQRAKKLQQMEEKRREEEISEKEAAIDKWRMKKINEVEERKREQELKLAADLVLCEVRKKQADVKRMQDIMRSLEKLRRLRKEAASRKGIVTNQECDEAFSSQLEQLRSVMKGRTMVYSVEEKALMVMLEGEQEEERRKEQEKRGKKERERQLHKKHRVESMLFGEDFPVDPILLPFREYYTQAQHSLQALIQIRREWDVFVVAADHPDATSVPQSWVMPEPPSDQDWAFALQNADTDRDPL